MSNETNKFKLGDIVRVLDGVRDPDFHINIGGWSGKVEQVHSVEEHAWIYEILWNKETLAMAGEDYEDRCESNNLDFERIDLEERELELVVISGKDNAGVFGA